MTTASPARAVAFSVLQRVARKGAWAAPSLDAEIGRASLTSRDAALATEIVYGVLRVRPAIDRVIAERLQSKKKLDGYVEAVLRGSVYQLLYLERVPPHAIVHDAVTLVRASRSPRVGSFVNAILRRVSRPDEVRRPQSVLVPDWLEQRLQAALGPDRTACFLRFPPDPAWSSLYVPRGRRDEVATKLKNHVDVRTSQLASSALVVRHAGDPRKLPGYNEGDFAIQGEASQRVVELLDAQPGERVLDACAGRGGKTLVLLAQVGPTGKVVAADINDDKLGQISGEAERLGLSSAGLSTVAVDWTVGAAGLDRSFDRVLLDAPCSAIGTLQRRPELLLRITPDDPARMRELQRVILARVLELVRPGGVLVYSVCSPMPEEGPEVIGGRSPSWPAAVDADHDGIVRIGPWLDGCPEAEAFQIFRTRVS